MTATGSSRTAETMVLRDGRTLGYAEFGDLSGKPLFFFHGGGDSRLQRHHDDSIAASLSIRLITVDRPGVGLSSFKRGRTLADWADDIAQLADSLKFDRFSLLGYSMGGPHALACAYRIPERLEHVGVVSGVAPLARPGGLEGVGGVARRMFVLARRSPFLAQAPLTLMVRKVRRDPEKLLDDLFADASEFDRSVHYEPDRRANHVAAKVEAARQGGRGLATELATVARPWGFRLEDIKVPVRLWYGTADNTTPLHMAEYLVETIPQAQLTTWLGEGHQAIFPHWREVLEALI